MASGMYFLDQFMQETDNADRGTKYFSLAHETGELLRYERLKHNTRAARKFSNWGGTFRYAFD